MPRSRGGNKVVSWQARKKKKLKRDKEQGSSRQKGMIKDEKRNKDMSHDQLDIERQGDREV
ncbi:uncharacterized protein N7469_009937 [Penicillium citrinum]|uniref:Uncharacterized protein n=1 Tax=Penicillium citrinum TaxID=5077 RepID=A0A9W9NJB5_PENCI|nr:uncharacterized protein N7469_009937 [Penicillium citrinum]KAJ5221050.1 hypothetical protein N7469_009937 [Penicillium citrinum]